MHNCKMALIPSESHSFPEQFVQDVGYARKARRQPAAPPPEPEPQKVFEPVQTEIQPRANRLRWWRLAGSRQAEKDRAQANMEKPVVPGQEPMFQQPRTHVDSAVTEPSVWLPAEQSALSPPIFETPATPMLAQGPEWPMNQNPVAAKKTGPIVDRSPIVDDKPALVADHHRIVDEPARAKVNQAPLMEQIFEPLLNQAAEMPAALAAPPEKFETPVDPPIAPPEDSVAAPDAFITQLEPALMPEPSREPEEAQSPKVFIPSLVPANLKRKVRWNNRAPQSEPVPATDANILNFHSDGQAAEPYMPSPPPPIPPLTSSKPKPDLRPTISLVPPPLEVPKPKPAPVVEQKPAPMEEPGSRTVEAPSADLVQTLLARALFANQTEAAAPVEPATPTLNFAPASHQPKTSHVPRRAPEPRPVVQKIEPVETRFVDSAAPAPKKRRSPKFRRFLICEAIAVAVLLPLAVVGILRVFQNPVMILIIDVITIAAAITATVMPILFFAVAPPLPRGEE